MSDQRSQVIETRIHAFRNATQALVFGVIESSTSASRKPDTGAADAASASATDANVAFAVANAREQLLQLKLACAEPQEHVKEDQR
jgi:hypothetical protein